MLQGDKFTVFVSIMHLLDHNCPVEVSSVGRSAYETQFIDFWDSICTGPSNIPCSSFSGDVHLYVPYWKDCWIL